MRTLIMIFFVLLSITCLAQSSKEDWNQYVLNTVHVDYDIIFTDTTVKEFKKSSFTIKGHFHQNCKCGDELPMNNFITSDRSDNSIFWIRFLKVNGENESSISSNYLKIDDKFKIISTHTKSMYREILYIDSIAYIYVSIFDDVEVFSFSLNAKVELTKLIIKKYNPIVYRCITKYFEEKKRNYVIID